MNCEEFELIGLDVDQSGADDDQRFAAREHLRGCPKCAALADSWEEARAELFLFADKTREAQAPARIEMRLRQEFRLRRRPVILYRHATMVAACALAAAAVIVVGFTWKDWWGSQRQAVANHGAITNPVPQQSALLSDSDSGSFTLLPGSIPQAVENASVLQVRMQRGALGALGLPVDQDRASDWIEVDLLVGEDGIPEAVRMHQDILQASSVQ